MTISWSGDQCRLAVTLHPCLPVSFLRRLALSSFVRPHFSNVGSTCCHKGRFYIRSRSLIGATNVNYRVKVVQTKTNTRQYGMSSLMPRSSSNSNARIVLPPKPSSKLSNSKRDNSAGHSEVNKDISGSSLALPSGQSRVIGDAKHVVVHRPVLGGSLEISCSFGDSLCFVLGCYAGLRYE